MPSLTDVVDPAAGRVALELLVILAAGAVVALATRRAGALAIAGYLLAGVVVGPHVLGWVGDGGAVAGGLGGAGVLAGGLGQGLAALLLFAVGLHLDTSTLRGGLAATAAAGLASTVVAMLAGWPVALALGLEGPAALAVAMALAVSSAAAVLRELQRRRESHRVRGRLCHGVLLVQGLAAVAMMAAMPALGAWAGRGDDAHGAGAWLGGGLLVVAGVAAAVVLGRVAMPRLLGAASAGAGAEGRAGVVAVVGAAGALAIVAAAAWLGVGVALGAFVAGFVLSSGPFRYQIAAPVAGLREVFIAAFFVGAGAGLDPGGLAGGWWVVLVGVGLIVVIKAVAIGLASWTAGTSGALAVFAGLALAQGGEFSLVLLDGAARAGAIGGAPLGRVVMVVAVSAALAAPVMSAGRWVGRWLARPAGRAGAMAESEEAAAAVEAPARGHAIVAGFGPVGRAVAIQLERLGVPCTVVELNPETVEKQADLGRSIVYGDAGSAEVLESAGLERAEAVVLTMPDREAMLRACRMVRELRPDVFIAARADVLSQGLRALQLGADHVVVEEVATAEAMAAQVASKLKERAAAGVRAVGASSDGDAAARAGA